MTGSVRARVWSVVAASLILSSASYCFAELLPPAVYTVEIETQSRPNHVAYMRDGSTQYMVVVEPLLIEVFGCSPGSGIRLVDSEPSIAALYKCAIGYFNDDEYWDVAATASLYGRVGIWLGGQWGDLDYLGNFDPETDFPDRLETGDFDEDGTDDLLITDFMRGKVVVMLNDGEGHFRAHAEYSDGAGHQEAVISDFNDDGHLDYMVTTQTFNESIQRFGDGTGNFLYPRAYSIESDGYTSSLADLDEDGVDDYICGTGRDIRVFKGRPSGVFRTSSSSFGFGFGPIQYRSVAGDFNGDGHQDVSSFITGAHGETSELQFWFGNGKGNLYPSETMFVEGIDLSREVWPEAVDLNDDEKTDLLITCNGANSLLVRAYVMQ